MPRNARWYVAIGVLVVLVICYKNMMDTSAMDDLSDAVVIQPLLPHTDGQVLAHPRAQTFTRRAPAKGVQNQRAPAAAAGAPSNSTDGWMGKWKNKLENCEISLAEDDFIDETSVIERPTSHLVTLASTDRPTFSNVSMLSLLLDTYGMDGFDFDGSTLGEKSIRRQHMFLSYCYETTASQIAKNCPRIAILPDNKTGTAQDSIPPYLYLAPSKLVKGKRARGIFTRIKLRTGLVFGPYVGTVKHQLHGYYAWRTYYHRSGKKLFIDGGDESASNWLRYVNSARWLEEQNVFAIESWGNVYYLLIKDIEPDDELLTWYGPGYLKSLGYSISAKYSTKVYGIAPDRKHIICEDTVNCDSIEN